MRCFVRGSGLGCGVWCLCTAPFRYSLESAIREERLSTHLVRYCCNELLYYRVRVRVWCLVFMHCAIPVQPKAGVREERLSTDLVRFLQGHIFACGFGLMCLFTVPPRH